MANYLKPEALDAGRVEDLVKQYFSDAEEVSFTPLPSYCPGGVWGWGLSEICSLSMLRSDYVYTYMQVHG